MAETQKATDIRPLQGDYVFSMKVSETDRERTLATRWRALEWGWYERARTAPDPEHPGINVVDLFKATHTRQGDPPSLEEATARNPKFQRFLISKAGENLAVVSSRFGYDQSGPVNVLEPQYGDVPELGVDMIDYSGSIYDEHLTGRHIGRVALLGGDPDQELPQAEADEIFRHLVRAAPDRG